MAACAGCPVAGNSYLFGCIASSDDAGEDYTPGTGFQCGERSRVEIPLTSSPDSANSAFSRFVIAVSPYADQAPGTAYTVSWRWVPPPPSSTPLPTDTASESATLTVGASASRSPSNTASDSASPSVSRDPSQTPTLTRTQVATRTRTLNSSPSRTAVS